ERSVAGDLERYRALVARAVRRAPERETVAALVADLERALAPPRRALLAAGAAAACALALAGWWLVRPAAPPRCPPPARRLGGVWDRARRQAMRAAFAASPLPSSAKQWAAVEPTIDRYAADWAARVDAACAAGALPAPRAACFDERLAGLRAWVTVFT